MAAGLDRRQYRLYVRPDVWWNAVDGMKAGVHFEGDYLRSLYQLDGTVWYNTGLGQESRYKLSSGQGSYSPIDYTLNYTTPISRNMPKLQWQINSRYLDGLWYQKGGVNWLATDHSSVQLYGLWMWCDAVQDINYLIDPTEWNSTGSNINSSLNAVWQHRYDYMSGSGRLVVSARAPFTGGGTVPFNYSYLQAEETNRTYVDRLEIRTRLFARLGFGTNIPSESALYMAGASPEDMMDNKYTRSTGMLPTEWEGISRYDVNHFQDGGGLDLRGYAGYFAPDLHNGSYMAGYKGRSGVAANAEVDLENYMPLSPKFFRNWLHVNVYAFGDAGIMQLSSYSLPNYTVLQPTDVWGTFHMDAGIGSAFTIKSWGLFEKARPLTIRFDVPLVLNRPPFSNNNYFTLRYVVGVNRAF
jgi:aminopeptidase N